MPATAGRVRMPANNRVPTSVALQTHGIWQSAVGYESNKEYPQCANVEAEGENPYTSFQGLMTLARNSSLNADEYRGACKRCGHVGHLSFQCRNFLSVKENKEEDQDRMKTPFLCGLEKIKGDGKVVEESEESETTDSEIERIIAERYGKKKSIKRRSSRRRRKDELDSNTGVWKRGRFKKRRSKKRDSCDLESEDHQGKMKRGKREKRRKREEERKRCYKRKSRTEKIK